MSSARTTILPCALALLLLGFVTAPGCEPGSESSLGDDACPSCELHLELELTLGGPEEPAVAGATESVVRDREGRYYLSHVYNRHEFFVLDHRGELLRTVGGAGEGPGEYVALALIRVTAGDTVRTFDNPLRRQTVLSPFPNLVVVRTQPIPAPVSGTRTALLPGGDLVISGPVQAPGAVGFPLHYVDETGARLHSFGADDPASGTGDPSDLARIVSPAGDGDAVWVAHPHEYRLQRWSLDGELQTEIRRAPDWLEPDPAEPESGPDFPPRPRIREVREDDEGRLWLLAHVPGADWHAGLREREGPEAPIYEAVDFERLFDTVVEVLDARGTLLVSQQVPQYLLTLAGPGQVVGYREAPGEPPALDIYSVELREP